MTSQTVGDLFYASSSTAVTRLADVVAGQPLLSGGTTTAPAYAGYTFSGTGGKTYTFPADSKTLAPTDSPTFSTYVILPNGASPTTDAAGKIAIRTGAGAASGVQYYGNAAPGSILLPGYQVASPMTIKSPTSADNYPYLYTPYAMTLKAVHYLCIGGTNWVGQLQICDANGGSCSNTQASDTTALAGTANNVTSFSSYTPAAGVWLGLKTTSTSGSPTSISVQLDYVVD